MKKILITGAAGFVGYHLSTMLLKENQDISLTLVDNLQRGRKDDALRVITDDKRVTFIELDLTDLNSYKKFGNGYDQVYHLAAVNGTKTFYEMPHEVLRINTLSVIYMLEWFRTKNPHGKFCFTSSNEAYASALGAFNQLPIPTPEEVPLVIEDPYNPRWSYAGTKLIGEQFVIHYAAKYDFKALIVRPHNFYGPRAGYGGHVIPDFSERINKRVDPFPIYGADDTRTFCYITDAIRAMIMLMNAVTTDTQPIQTVHIGDTEEITIRDLADKLFNITKWKPANLDIKEGPKGSVKRRLADISKLHKLTGWKPEVSLNEGLKLTYEWYTKYPKQ